ncbi:hypothetical protein MASR1M45_13090 [Candidatus Kapaibacterium sp.]
MKIRTKLVFTALLLLTSLSANAQLIGEGDTLWYKSLYPNTISHVQFSPDGSKLGVVSYDGKYVGKFVMYDALTGEELWQFGLATHYFKQFSYSLDGQHIYVLPPSNLKISVLKVSNGDLVDTLPVTKGENVKFDYDQVFQTNNSNILLLSNYNGYFALYDVNQRKITKEKATNRVSRINASPYSDYFILAYQYESAIHGKLRLICTT